jgi:hypothetical protein
MDITKIWKKMGKYAACARELWTGWRKKNWFRLE